MKLEELNELKRRISEAEKVQGKLKQLRDALAMVEKGETLAVLLDFRPGRPPLHYAGSESQHSGYTGLSLTNVCWSNGYPEVRDEIRECVVDVLKNKVQVLEHELDQL